eukprot:263026_1
MILTELCGPSIDSSQLCNESTASYLNVGSDYSQYHSTPSDYSDVCLAICDSLDNRTSVLWAWYRGCAVPGPTNGSVRPKNHLINRTKEPIVKVLIMEIQLKSPHQIRLGAKHVKVERLI